MPEPLPPITQAIKDAVDLYDSVHSVKIAEHVVEHLARIGYVIHPVEQVGFYAVPLHDLFQGRMPQVNPLRNGWEDASWIDETGPAPSMVLFDGDAGKAESAAASIRETVDNLNPKSQAAVTVDGDQVKVTASSTDPIWCNSLDRGRCCMRTVHGDDVPHHYVLRNEIW